MSTAFDTYQSLLAAIAADGEPSREVHDPATGELIARVPIHDEADLAQAIERLRT